MPSFVEIGSMVMEKMTKCEMFTKWPTTSDQESSLIGERLKPLFLCLLPLYLKNVAIPLGLKIILLVLVVWGYFAATAVSAIRKKSKDSILLQKKRKIYK